MENLYGLTLLLIATMSYNFLILTSLSIKGLGDRRATWCVQCYNSETGNYVLKPPHDCSFTAYHPTTKWSNDHILNSSLVKGFPNAASLWGNYLWEGTWLIENQYAYIYKICIGNCWKLKFVIHIKMPALQSVRTFTRVNFSIMVIIVC